MRRTEEERGLGFRIIGAMKLASALLLGVAGFGIFRLLDRDLGEALEHFASRLHLDPENRLVHEVVYRAAGIDGLSSRCLVWGRSSMPCWKGWRVWAWSCVGDGPSTSP